MFGESDTYFPKDNESGQRGDGKSEHQQFRNQWTKMDGNGKFNSDDPCYLLLWARIPWKKWSSTYSQQKTLKYSSRVQSQKWQNDLSLFPSQTAQLLMLMKLKLNESLKTF